MTKSLNVTTRDVRKLDVKTGNIYESIVVISKRANQISADIKEEMTGRLSEFNSSNDSLEEISDNREQTEIAVQYEKMPKATLLATEEFLEGRIYYRNPSKK